MIGEPRFQSYDSAKLPANLARDIFARLRRWALGIISTYFGQDVTDDHSPLNAVGIPVIDLIDFRFSYWHTADDTIDKLSAQSLPDCWFVAVYYLSEFRRSNESRRPHVFNRSRHPGRSLLRRVNCTLNSIPRQAGRCCSGRGHFAGCGPRPRHI